MTARKPGILIKAALSFLTHRNCETVEVYYFKLLSFGMVSYGAIDN